MMKIGIKVDNHDNRGDISSGLLYKMRERESQNAHVFGVFVPFDRFGDKRGPGYKGQTW